MVVKPQARLNSLERGTTFDRSFKHAVIDTTYHDIWLSVSLPFSRDKINYSVKMVIQNQDNGCTSFKSKPLEPGF